MNQLTTDFIDERILIIIEDNDINLLKDILTKYNQNLSDECDFESDDYLFYVDGMWHTSDSVYHSPDAIEILTSWTLEKYLFKLTIGNTIICN